MSRSNAGGDHPSPYDGLINFRDVGGHPLTDGGTMTTGVVFRSGRFDALHPRHDGHLIELGIGVIVDLRTDRERADVGGHADLFRRQSTITVVDLPYIVGGSRPPTEDAGRIRSFAPDALAPRYIAMTEREGRFALARLFALLADPSAPPAVVHCWSGKDRTGLTAAVLQEIAGVSDDHIGEDYAATRRWFDTHIDDHPELRVAPHPEAYQPDARTMEMTFSGLRDRYGSIREMLIDSGADEAHIETVRTRLRSA